MDVAIGGNLGTDEQLRRRFRAALRLLASIGGFALEASEVYTSLPVGPVADQPRYLNAAVRMKLPPAADPHRCLRELLAIELALGRRRPSRPAKGPRKIDLDLIAWRVGDWQWKESSPWLTLPHPAAVERPFVTTPLANLTPIAATNGPPFCGPLRQLL